MRLLILVAILAALMSGCMAEPSPTLGIPPDISPIHYDPVP